MESRRLLRVTCSQGDGCLTMCPTRCIPRGNARTCLINWPVKSLGEGIWSTRIGGGSPTSATSQGNTSLPPPIWICGNGQILPGLGTACFEVLKEFVYEQEDGDL